MIESVELEDPLSQHLAATNPFEKLPMIGQSLLFCLFDAGLPKLSKGNDCVDILGRKANIDAEGGFQKALLDSCSYYSEVGVRIE